MHIKPIKTPADYDAAVSEIERLMDAVADTPAGDRLEVLSILVQAYEDDHWPMEPPDPIDAILFRMEQQELSRHDIEVYIGGRSRVSEVLNRKRPLTMSMIRRLHAGLGIPAEVLIKPAAKRRSRRQSAA